AGRSAAPAGLAGRNCFSLTGHPLRLLRSARIRRTRRRQDRQLLQGTPVRREKVSGSNLVDAARVDGMGTVKLITRVFVPLSKAAVIGAGLILFTTQWQEYLW